MSRFLFYYGLDRSTASRIRRELDPLWNGIEEYQSGPFWLFAPAVEIRSIVCNDADVLGAVAGYARMDKISASPQRERNLDLSGADVCHHRCLLREIGGPGNWPLKGQWTGSFSAVAYGRKSGELILCNDLLGYMPLYYSRTRNGILGATSLIALSHCQDYRVDVVGLLQRITPPYCNYGRRTLLGGVWRLLPGECVRCSSGHALPERTYDNTLFENVLPGSLPAVARYVWSCLQSEINAACEEEADVCIAMSGGWDSRLVLAALPRPAQQISCYTYGNEAYYESRIARRCADAVGASHRCFPIQKFYFPSRDWLQRAVHRTESALFLFWCSILDYACRVEDPTRARMILLGDHCESLDGRNLTVLASRRARRRSFVRGHLGLPDQIADATPVEYDRWKQRKTAEILDAIFQNREHLPSQPFSNLPEEDIIRNTLADLELSFARVEAHKLSFTPIYDELFSWFHRVRFQIASQNLMLAAAFRAVSPTMSMRSLRVVSRVHPRMRMRRRLIDAIARLPENGPLSRIPSAQIPWISARAPTLLRELVWGLRSGLDDLMTERVLATKDPTKRQRVLPSLDLLTEYRREYVSTTVGDWFSGRWVRGDAYLERIKHRANLEEWPWINVDIAAPANVSVILDACRLA